MYSYSAVMVMITLPAKKDARYQCSFLLFSFYCIPDTRKYSLSFEFIVAIQTQKGNKIRIQNREQYLTDL